MMSRVVRCFVSAMVFTALSGGTAFGYLRLHPSNPHYLQETTTGEPVMITTYGNIVPTDMSYDGIGAFHTVNQAHRSKYARCWHFLPWSGANAVWPWAYSTTGGAYWGGRGGLKARAQQGGQRR